ncbi:hypothetical protein [Candidatus Palauibacter sp.]|uniref:hypothetical protein n=1 Tax=Candidatus Palauibacter sp. TaxID=3101350 RepID=UPI003B02608D
MNVLLPVAITIAVPAAIAGQAREAGQGMTEREAAAVLLHDRDSPDVWRAIDLAVDLGPRAGGELRAAVIEAAWAEVRREAAARAGVGRTGETDIDRMFMLFEAAEAFRDPQAIPLMIEALKNGGGVYDALADLGAAAFPAVLAAVNDPGGDPYRVSGGLTVLRFMVEDGSLGPRQMEQVREAARDRLSGTQDYFPDYFFIDDAVRLALALGDPELRRTVERIAADRAYVETLVSRHWKDRTEATVDGHARAVDHVHARARLFLSGGGADIGPTRRRTPPR